MINEKQINLLNKYDWNLDLYKNNFSFSVSHEDGSCITNSEEALIFLLAELEEEELANSPEKQEKMEDVLEFFGYEIICESPLEITHKDDQDVFISGFAAILLVSNLRSKKFINDLK